MKRYLYKININFYCLFLCSNLTIIFRCIWQYTPLNFHQQNWWTNYRAKGGSPKINSHPSWFLWQYPCLRSAILFLSNSICAILWYAVGFKPASSNWPCCNRSIIARGRQVVDSWVPTLVGLFRQPPDCCFKRCQLQIM